MRTLLVFVLSAVFSATFANAAWTMEPISHGPMRTTVSGEMTTVTTYKNSANNKYYQSTNTFSRARIGEYAKKFAKSPTGLALLAAMVAADYYFGEDEEVYTTGWVAPEYTLTGVATFRAIYNFNVNPALTPEQQADGAFVVSVSSHGRSSSMITPINVQFQANGYTTLSIGTMSTCSVTPCSVSGNTTWSAQGAGKQPISGLVSYTYYRTDTGPDYDFEPAPWGYPEQQPVTDDDIGRWLIDNKPWYVPEVLTYPNGQPMMTPEVAASGDKLLEDYFVEQGLDPALRTEIQPVPSVDADYSELPPLELDFPLFCGWASIICDFVDWVRLEPEYEAQPDAPIIELDALDVPSYSSGLPSSASCPAPLILTVYTKPISISYDAFCELAAIIRPLLIAMAYIMSAYIVLGIGARR